MTVIEAIWNDIGFIRYPLAFSWLTVILLTLFSSVRLVETKVTPDLRTKAWIDAILFWGAFAVISGVLGTLVGIVIAAQSIEAAGAVSSTLVWGGIKVAMLSSVTGVLILALSAVIWFVLQLRWRFLVAAHADRQAVA